MYSKKPVGFIYMAVAMMILRINTCIHSVQSSFIEHNNIMTEPHRYAHIE